MNIQKQVFEIIANVLNVNIDEIKSESTIGDFHSWDSLGQLNILQMVQEQFGIEFDFEEMMDMENVNDIIKSVESKL